MTEQGTLVILAETSWWAPIIAVVLFTPLILIVARKDLRAAARHKEAQREAKIRAVEAERERRMVTPDLDVDQAQKVVWAWEEMTEQERAALPLERRVEFRAVREAFGEHKRQHPDLHR